MAMIRKLTRHGDARVVCIPKGWLTFWERKLGQSIREVELEVNETLVIRPLSRDMEEK